MTNPVADSLGITELRKDIAEVKELLGQLLVDTRPSHYTVAQAAEARGVSARTIARQIKAGKLERTPQGIPREQI